MFSLVLGYLIAVIVPILCYFKQYKTLLLLSISSISTEILYVEVAGFKFMMVSFIAISTFFMGHSSLKSGFKNLGLMWSEYSLVMIVGAYFLFFAPWSDPHSYQRAWTQTLTGRTLTGGVRIMEYLFIMHLFYLFAKKIKNVLLLFSKFLLYITIAQVFISFADVFLLGAIKSALLPVGSRIMENRFTGLNVEPRVFGRVLSIGILTLLTIGSRGVFSYRFYNFMFLILMGGALLLTMSASAISTTLLSMLYLAVFVYKIDAKIIIFVCLFLWSAFWAISNIKHFKEHFEARAQQTLVENVANRIKGVPLWISGLEVFDATATAFFYKNPQYLLLGVGPNTISIPSSRFLSRYNKSIYGNKIDSIPHMGILQILSRSGILGIILIIVNCINIYNNKIYDMKIRHFFIVILFFNVFVLTNFFYAIIGLLSYKNIKNND